MKYIIGIIVSLTLVGAFLIGAGLAQAPPQSKRLTCEEITGGLYIANAQMSEQLREATAQLAEARAELAKRQTPPEGSVRPETK